MAKKIKTKTDVAIASALEAITVDRARTLLSGQKKNRPLKQSKVKHIAKDIAEGRWAMNGESIVLDTDGDLLDGQHRLAALIYAAEKLLEDETLSIKSIIVSGVPRSLFATFDQGEKRSLADVVAIDDHPYPADLAVAIRLLVIRLAGKKVSGTGKLSHADSLAVLEDHPNLQGWVEYVVDLQGDEDTNWLRVGNLISPGYMAALCYLASLDYENDVIENFLKALTNQDHEKKGCPAVALRKVLLKNRMDKDSKLKRDALVSYVVKAILAFANGDEILTLKLKDKEYPTFGSERPETDSDASED